MGKKIIPPQDQERLARIMNEKERMIGVRVIASKINRCDGLHSGN